MHVIKDRAMVPLGGWDYIQVLTVNGETKEYRLVSHSLTQLGLKVVKFRKANGLPFNGDIDAEVQDQICNRRPELCRETDRKPIIGRIAEFGRAMLGWANQGFKTVPEEVLHIRQETCLQCEHWTGWREVGIGKCRKCGCPVGRHMQIKLYLPNSECPVKKWGKYQP